MALKLNDPQFRADVIGMPDSHAACFKDIAQSQKVVIISRATGPTCRQLLAQGYDTKGFRIHAKSCDWGPMAGFVMRDPRLSKKGLKGAKYNASEHRTAMTDSSGSGWTASTVPLKLYRSRINWLRRKRLINITQDGPNCFRGFANKGGVSFRYQLRRERSLPGEVWGVYLDNVLHRFRQQGSNHARRPHLEPLLAMTNSVEHRSWRGNDFRNAVTGDYDLFAVWPYDSDYDHHGRDRRVLGTVKGWSERHRIERDLERNFTQGGQGTKLGNMTDRLYEVCQYLNSSIGAAVEAVDGDPNGPFPNRNVLWHSTESARPFVDDIDFPIIAFAPSGLEVGIETVDDFREFVDGALEEGIHVMLAEGWTMKRDRTRPNRLGRKYARLVPSWDHLPGPSREGDPRGIPNAIKVPDWYNG